MAADPLLIPALKNWDYVGRCYDLLTVDPLNLQLGTRFQQAFALTEFDTIPDQSASKPTACDYLPAPGGDYDRHVSEISSAYDYRSAIKLDGSVTASDPTGQLFSGSLSTSYQQNQEATEKNSRVVTYVSEVVTVFKLQVRTAGTALAPALAAKLAALPTEPGTEHEGFFAEFGTHYSQRVTYGGRATQRIVMTREDFETFLAEGIDVRANAEATFKVAKVGVSAGVADTRSKRFTEARGVTTESIRYAGGNPQQLFDMWAMTVKSDPAPVEIAFQPLYSLLTAELFPRDTSLATRRAALETATNSYLSTRGHDCTTALLRAGDRVTLTLVANGPRSLLTATPRYVSTRPARQPGGEVVWVLTDAADPASTATLTRDSTVVLAAGTSLLDAAAGRDDTYARGDGLAGLVTTPGDTARWTLELATDLGRSELVDGDYVHLRGGWSEEDGEPGYLLGQSAQDDPGRRVFAFGKPKQKGATWRINRVP